MAVISLSSICMIIVISNSLHTHVVIYHILLYDTIVLLYEIIINSVALVILIRKHMHIFDVKQLVKANGIAHIQIYCAT